MKKNFILFILLIFVFVGCVPQNITVTENAVTPTVTKIIPSSTPTLIKPTPTIYLSPLPTLSDIETFDKLYKSEFECDMPCWWGIIPGVSTWIETKQFAEQFSVYVFGIDKSKKPITKSKLYDTYVWYVHNPIPGTDSSAMVIFDVQNNMVTAIEIGHELVWYFFPVYKLLEEYGRPDKVLVSIGEYSVGATDNYVRIYVLYEDKNILTGYEFSSSRETDPLNVCLIEYGERSMILWSPGTELNFDFSTLKPLEEFSELTPQTFYEKFKDENNKCFEISKSAWE